MKEPTTKSAVDALPVDIKSTVDITQSLLSSTGHVLKIRKVMRIGKADASPDRLLQTRPLKIIFSTSTEDDNFLKAAMSSNLYPSLNFRKDYSLWERICHRNLVEELNARQLNSEKCLKIRPGQIVQSYLWIHPIMVSASQPQLVLQICTPSMTSENEITIFYTNACSLLSKFAELQDRVLQTIPDVVVTIESWLHTAVLEAEIHLWGYYAFKCDRVDRMGGGVIVYVKSSLKTTEVPLPTDACQMTNYNAVLCQICVAAVTLPILAVYRSPQSTSLGCYRVKSPDASRLSHHR